MEKTQFEKIFGQLAESSVKVNLEPNEYTFKIDRSDGTLMGAFVNIDGTIYSSNASGDGVYDRITTKAKAANLKFVSPVKSGLFK